jgi:hypothetical protein
LIEYIEFKTNDHFCVTLENVPEKFYNGLKRKFSTKFFSYDRSSTPVIVSIKFKQQLADVEYLKMVGRKFLFDESACYLSENTALVKIQFDKLLDEDFTIYIEPNFDPIRFVGYLLEPIIRIRLLKKGFVSIHSSSCYINGQMFLFPAWGNVGKTNLILAMHKNGATIFGDDWTTITPDGKALIDIRPLNLLFYNFKVFPEYLEMISWKKKFFLKLDSIIRDKSSLRKQRSATMLRIYELTLRLTETLSNTHISLDSIQENKITESEVTSVYLMMKHKEQSIKKFETIEIEEIAKKSAICFVYENQSFFNNIEEYMYATGNSLGSFINDIENMYIEVFKNIFNNPNLNKGLILLPEEPERDVLNMFAIELIGMNK